jgi:SAM-dependent methyltransferase
VLGDIVRPTADARLYVTEQTTPLFRHLGRGFRNAVGSEYLGRKVPLGATLNGVRNEDLTALTFADGSFDYVVSLDVLEHVPDDRAAFSECYRCLAPGGVLLFTAPFDLASRENIVRARMTEDGSVGHIRTPEYHGNPVDPEKGALCYRYFGWEVIQQLEAVGFVDVQALVYWSRDLAYLGGDQVIFTARKPAGATTDLRLPGE